MPMALPVHPGGMPWARTAGALNERISSPASKDTQTKGALALRNMDNVASLWDESPEG